MCEILGISFLKTLLYLWCYYYAYCCIHPMYIRTTAGTAIAHSLYIKNITLCSNHRHFLCFFQDIELSLVLLLWPQQHSTHVQKYLQEKAEERCQAVSLSSRMVLHTNANPSLAMGTDHSLAGIVHQNRGLVMDHAHRGRWWW